ncbi:MAG: hypothetical protein AAB370_01045 [Verrucomicrobiota bacterium]
MDTLPVPLIDSITVALERPREVTAQVSHHVIETYGIAREAVGEFLVNELARLEDYQVDLILSPVFTPNLSDQAPIAELLGRGAIPAVTWPDLIQQLTRRPTRAQLIAEGGVKHEIELRDVTIERFVRRLHLDGTIAEDVFALIGSLPESSERAMLKAIARRAVWRDASRREILTRFLGSPGPAFQVDDVVALLKLVETYELAGIADLLARIPQWQQVLRQEINTGGAKPFFNERVEELHGGGRDQRRQDNNRVSAKEMEQAFLERLQRALA